MKIKVDPLMSAINRYIAKADNDLEDVLLAEGFVAADLAVKSITEIENGVTGALTSYADEVLMRLQAATGLPDFISGIWPEIMDAETLEKELHKLFRSQFDSMMHEFSFEWIISQDPMLPIKDERITIPAQEFVKSWSLDLSKIMRLNTNTQVEKILLRADEAKLTIDQVADQIAQSGIRECGFRSRRVALTEVLRMESYAQQESFIQNAAVYKKRWIDPGIAEEPRENHMAMTGQEVFKREKFVLYGADGGIYTPICPRDTSLPASESINCHCRMDEIADANVLGMTPEERAELRTRYMDEIDREYEAIAAADEAAYMSRIA